MGHEGGKPQKSAFMTFVTKAPLPRLPFGIVIIPQVDTDGHYQK